MSANTSEGQGTIKPGTPLRCRDAVGEWHEKVATSAVEGCYDAKGRRIHDFAGVYVRRVNHSDLDELFWPLEDVELA